MAGQASNSVEVIGGQFLTQEPFDLKIANDEVTDVNGTLIFSVEKRNRISLHSRRYLKDAAGEILVTLRKKIWTTMHKRLQVFRGKSKDENHLLFSVKIPSLTARRTQLDVFLKSNKSERVPDFKVKGNTIYYLRDGEPDVIIAQMATDTGNLAVKVHRNVDYAFVVALVVAVALVVGDNSHDSRRSQGIKMVKAVAEVAIWVAEVIKWVAEWDD